MSLFSGESSGSETGLLGAIQNAAGNSGEDMALGEDIMEIRRSVIGSSSYVSAEDSKTIYNKLADKYQVNLNSESVVKGLEDATLVGHMASARLNLAEETDKNNKLPTPGDLTRQYVNCRILNSASLQSMDSALSNDAMLIDEFLLRVDHLQALATGGPTPHGFPVTSPENMLHMVKKLTELAYKMDANNKTLQADYKNFLTIRREYEAVADGRERLYVGAEQL